MTERLVVESVSSSSLLRRSLSPGEAGDYGAYEDETLEVETESEAEQLVNKYPNVRYASESTESREGETVRMEADNDGVRTVDDGDEPQGKSESETFHCGVNGCSREVDDPDGSCWQHSDG